MADGKENDVLRWDIETTSRAIRDKKISPVEIIYKLLERIESENKKLNSYITVLPEAALDAASQAEKEILTGNIRGPFHGIPIGLKDLIYTKDVRTTMGSEIFRDFVPTFDATVVEKLKKAGAIIVGKLNTHEFAYGPTGDRSFFGPVKNPHNISKITGGSSSGSGAAVASYLCYAALGTDTGGSVRIPSACCGIVGMKPTFGRVSKYGVYSLSFTLDHVGPMTRSVKDNALLLGIISGYDPQDPYSANRETENFTRYLDMEIRGSSIGIPSSFYLDTLEDAVWAKFIEAVEIFRSLGADVKVVEIDRMQEIADAFQIIIKSEAYAVHEENLKQFPDKYDDEVKERILLGLAPKAYEYVNAQRVREFAIGHFNEILTEVDVLITPTLSILPTDIGQREVMINGVQHQVRSALNRLTRPTNFNGFPSLSIPCPSSHSEMPIGIQLIGKLFDEVNLYRFAYAFERGIKCTSNNTASY